MKLFNIMIFVVIFWGISRCSFAGTTADLRLKIKITNFISLDQNEMNKEPIDYFIGAPLFISVTLFNQGAQKNFNQNKSVTSQSSQIHEKGLEDFQGIKIGSKSRRWVTYLKMKICPSQNEELNILDDIPILAYEDQIKASSSREDILRLSGIETVFRFSGVITKKMTPGLYKLSAEYDNPAISQENGGDYKKVLSNTVEFEIKEASSNYEKAQVLIHNVNLQIANENFDKVWILCHDVIQLCPEFPTPYFDLAAIQLQRGDYVNAKKTFEKYINVIQTTPIEFWSQNEVRRNFEIYTAKEKIACIAMRLKQGR